MRRIVFGIAALFTGALAGPVAAQIVGQLLNVRGEVAIQRGRQRPQHAETGSQLRPADRVTTRGGAAEVVLFRDGQRFELLSGSTVRVGPAVVSGVSGAPPHRLGAISPTFRQALRTPGAPVPQRIMGLVIRSAGEEALGPARPTPNGAVREETATLRWEGPIEGDRLVLQVSDGMAVVHRIELPAAARSYMLPGHLLHPGRWYVWFVTAIRDGAAGQKCYALLRVLTPDERALLGRTEREAAANDPALLLLRAQLAERLGLFDEARAGYQAVLRLRPEDAGMQAALKRPSLAAP